MAELLDCASATTPPIRTPRGDYIWSHANAVEVDPRDDTLIVSVRHQDAVLKLTRDGEIRWILAPTPTAGRRGGDEAAKGRGAVRGGRTTSTRRWRRPRGWCCSTTGTTRGPRPTRAIRTRPETGRGWSATTSTRRGWRCARRGRSPATARRRSSRQWWGTRICCRAGTCWRRTPGSRPRTAWRTSREAGAKSVRVLEIVPGSDERVGPVAVRAGGGGTARVGHRPGGRGGLAVRGAGDGALTERAVHPGGIGDPPLAHRDD
ncbi:MAG: aryl-sulfate sulfotransferase [Myxococcota bacterium]